MKVRKEELMKLFGRFEDVSKMEGHFDNRSSGEKIKLILVDRYLHPLLEFTNATTN